MDLMDPPFSPARLQTERKKQIDVIYSDDVRGNEREHVCFSDHHSSRWNQLSKRVLRIHLLPHVDVSVFPRVARTLVIRDKTIRSALCRLARKPLRPPQLEEHGELSDRQMARLSARLLLGEKETEQDTKIQMADG